MLEALAVTFDNATVAFAVGELTFAVVWLGGLSEKLALRWSKLDFCWCTKNAFVGGEYPWYFKPEWLLLEGLGLLPIEALVLVVMDRLLNRREGLFRNSPLPVSLPALPILLELNGEDRWLVLRNFFESVLIFNWKGDLRRVRAPSNRSLPPFTHFFALPFPPTLYR